MRNFVRIALGCMVLAAAGFFIPASAAEDYECNCVLWVRANRVPSLPAPMNTLAEKRSHINAYVPQVGFAAVMNTGSVGHVAYVADVWLENGIVKIRVEEANYTPCRVTYGRQGTPQEMNVDGYYDPNSKGRPDLLGVKKSGTPNGRAEVHFASESSNFGQFILHSGTVQPVEAGTGYDFRFGDWNGDRRPDMFAIKRTNTGSGRVEVHVANGAGNFRQNIFSVATPVAADYNGVHDFHLTDWDRDGRSDLVALRKPLGYETGVVRVTIYSGASNFQNAVFSGDSIHTVEAGVAYDFQIADWNRDTTPDLIALKKSHTGSGRLEAHILSGASNFRQYLLNVATVQPAEAWVAYDYRFGDWDRDGRIDLFAIKRSNTPSGRAEVHVSSGASNFGSYILNAVTGQQIDADYSFELADW